jgi:hypothetical protein
LIFRPKGEGGDERKIIMFNGSFALKRQTGVG